MKNTEWKVDVPRNLWWSMMNLLLGMSIIWLVLLKMGSEWMLLSAALALLISRGQFERAWVNILRRKNNGIR